VNNIKTYRVSKGMTQVKLAEKVGITQAYLSVLENNNSRLDSEIINKIAGVLCVPAINLVGMNDEYFKDLIKNVMKNMNVHQLNKILDYSKMVKAYGRGAK